MSTPFRHIGMHNEAAEGFDNGSEAAVSDDYSAAFHKVRSQLVDQHGREYVEFVRGMRPQFSVVYRDIAFGYAMLALTALVATYWLRSGSPAWAVMVLGGASFGFWIAYLQLFIHEAAHFNLAVNRSLSDRLGNVLIAWMVGTSVARYRKVHFDHHRYLGTTGDPEFSYVYPLNVRFLIKSLVGWRAVESLLSRRRRLHTGSGCEETGGGQASETIVSRAGTARGIESSVPYAIAGICAHLVLLVVAWQLASWPLAGAWCVGVGVMFPFFAALRPLLEHRDEKASFVVDYRRNDHGAYTRLFGDDPFSATFGGAGFNKHLLHHWEPRVSYTRLRELERFLADTQMQPIMKARRSSYGETLRRLFTLY